MDVSRELKKGQDSDPSRSLLSAREEKKAASEVNTTARHGDYSIATPSVSVKAQTAAKAMDRDEAKDEKLSSQLGAFNLSNTHVQSSLHSHVDKKPPAAESKRNHHPQIIDEDTERFKMRLEEMINKFKLETLTEFMSAKKNLLDEQANTIGHERMISDSRYQSKCFEVGVS